MWSIHNTTVSLGKLLAASRYGIDMMVKYKIQQLPLATWISYFSN